MRSNIMPMTRELKVGLQIMVSTIAVELMEMAYQDGNYQFWWVKLLFVKPDIELLKIDVRCHYRELHSACKTHTGKDYGN